MYSLSKEAVIEQRAAYYRSVDDEFSERSSSKRCLINTSRSNDKGETSEAVRIGPPEDTTHHINSSITEKRDFTPTYYDYPEKVDEFPESERWWPKQSNEEWNVDKPSDPANNNEQFNHEKQQKKQGRADRRTVSKTKEEKIEVKQNYRLQEDLKSKEERFRSKHYNRDNEEQNSICYNSKEDRYVKKRDDRGDEHWNNPLPGSENSQQNHNAPSYDDWEEPDLDEKTPDSEFLELIRNRVVVYMNKSPEKLENLKLGTEVSEKTYLVPGSYQDFELSDGHYCSADLNAEEESVYDDRESRKGAGGWTFFVKTTNTVMKLPSKTTGIYSYQVETQDLVSIPVNMPHFELFFGNSEEPIAWN